MTVYELVTNRIISELENGVVPWRKPWVSGGLPKNFVTKKAYRGINCLLLHLSGFVEPYYLTFQQIKKLGGSVKGGSRSQIVVYWNWIESKTETDSKGEPVVHPLLKYYRVFNIEQVTGITYESAVKQFNEFEKNDQCEGIVTGYVDRPEITNLKQQAFYNPAADIINLPVKESFASSQEYYATLFHELVHSTGHSKRLNREGVKDLNDFGSEIYSKEELIAEIGASFLCARAGIENQTFKNSVAYIQGWLSVIKKDSKFLIHSATKAQKAADYILKADFKTEEKP